MLPRNVARRGRLAANSRCRLGEKAGTQQTARCNCALPVARLNRKVAAVAVKTEAEITRARSRKIWIALTVMAIIALVAAFFLDQSATAWITAHSSAELKRVMRIVSRVGDWPAHMVAGAIGIAIAFAAGSKAWMRIFLAMLVALALAGMTARATKIATGRRSEER